MSIWLRRQPLFLPFIGVALTVFTVDKDSIVAWLLLTTLVITALLCNKRILLLTLCFTLSAGIFHASRLESQQQTTALLNQEVEVYGIIDSPPRETFTATEAIIKIIQGPENLTGTRLIGFIPNKYQVNIGEKIWLKGTVRKLYPARNPEVFNKKEFLYRQGISVALRVDQAILSHKIAPSHKLESFASSSRLWIREKLTQGIAGTDAAKIILAMFLGEKPERDSEIIADFKNSGTIHVFAVSGLHVMMIGLIFTILLRICRCPPYIWIPAVISIMFFYAIVTGMRPPAMRASIMSATVLIAILLQRKPSLPNCIWLSGIIAILWNTHSLFLPGFQLSYIVLIAIAFTGNWWARRFKWIETLDPFLPLVMLNKRQKCMLWIRKKIAGTLAVSTSAWSGSSILIWLYFGLITPIAIIASIPLMLSVFLLLSLCCISLTLGSLSPDIGKWINTVNTYAANSAHYFSNMFASIPYSRFQYQPWATGERIVVYHIREGGGGVYLSLGGGILLDAGNNAKFHNEMLPSLSKNGARIDTLIASHPDINHTQGLIAALEKFPIKQLVIPNGNARNKSYAKLINTAKDKRIKLISSQETSFPIAKKTKLELLYSPPAHNPLADDRNLVFMLHWHDKHILFVNDSGSQFTHWIRNNKYPIQPDIIIMGKHIEDGSLPADVIELLKPKTIIATKSNFPPNQSRSKQWISEIRNLGIQLYLLDESGATTITREGNELKLDTTSKIH